MIWEKIFVWEDVCLWLFKISTVMLTQCKFIISSWLFLHIPEYIYTRLTYRPTSPIEFYADVWSARSHTLKIGKRCWSDVWRINRQSIVYKSVAHLSDIEVASIDDSTLWNWTAICLSLDVGLPNSKDIVRWSAHSSPSTDARPMLKMFGRASPDYLSITCRCFYDEKNHSIEKLGRASENF